VHTDKSFLISERPYLCVLSQSQLEGLHFSSLRVLERTGMVFNLPEAIDLLLSAGCRKLGKNRLSIPSSVVDETLRGAPKQIRISSRDGEPAMLLAQRNVYYGTGSDLPHVIDPYSGQRRAAVAEDVGKFARVCDYSQNIDFVMSMALASDRPVEVADLYQFEAMVKNTTRPILFTATNRERLEDIYKMCVAVRGSKLAFEKEPFVIHYAEPSSPLQHSKDALEKLLFCAEHGIPVTYPSGTSLGATAPITIAGAMVMSNAEFLGGLVLSQLKRKGAPIIYGGGNSPIDMHTAFYCYAAPESFLNGMVMRELSAYYGLPCFGEGGCGDAKTFDQQAASEASFSLLLGGLIGTNLIHDVGYVEGGVTGSYEMVLLSDELIGEVRRFLQGVDVTEETMSVKVLDEVGPGGNFLIHPHTLKHFKTSIYNTIYFNRQSYDEWEKRGSRTLGQVLNEKVRWILENHRTKPLSADVTREIHEIISESESRLK